MTIYRRVPLRRAALSSREQSREQADGDETTDHEIGDHLMALASEDTIEVREESARTRHVATSSRFLRCRGPTRGI